MVSTTVAPRQKQNAPTCSSCGWLAHASEYSLTMRRPVGWRVGVRGLSTCQQPALRRPLVEKEPPTIGYGGGPWGENGG
eukprot:scaffold12252_cov93-Isochrysis_galbana.AAC.8